MLKKLLTVLSVSLLLCLSYLALFHSNVDSHLHNRQRFEQISESEMIIAQPRQLSFLGTTYGSLSAKLESEIEAEAQAAPTIEDTINSIQPACINYKDPSKLTPKEQLLEFIKGPCAPVVIVPGIFASKLTVHIDCPTLRDNHPEIFSACGWSTCSSYQFWKSKPSSDYMLWMSDVVSAMTLATSSGNNCFGHLIQSIYDPTQTNIKDKYVAPAGVTVSVYGEKGTAYETNQCGLDSLEDLLPIPYQTASSKGLKLIKDNFKAYGYQIGLTLYGAAYDWRSTTLVNGIAEGIKTTLKQIYELTGKKTVIIAHSMGNIGTLTALNALTFEEKEKYVANYVSISSALVGAPKIVRTILGGNPEYGYYGIGLDFNAQQLLMRNGSSTFDVFPKDAYQRFAGQPWMNDWNERMAMENTYVDSIEEGTALWQQAKKSQDYPFPWFPSPLENCTVGFTGKPDFCGMFMYNWTNETMLEIEGTAYSGSSEDLKNLLDSYSEVDVSPYWKDILADSRSNDAHLLKNPEVPVTLIYVSHVNTETNYVWNQDPLEHAHDDVFIVPDSVKYRPGDSTVPTASVLLPALKWSWEYDHREDDDGVTNAKPVKTVEMCSVQNNKGNIYDVKDSSKPYEVNKNEYIGATCSCMTGTSDHRVIGDDCLHSSILADQNLAVFLTNIAQTNQVIKQVETVGAYSLTEDQVAAVQNTCPVMNKGVSVYFQITQLAAQ